MSAGPRERLVTTTLAMMRERGVHATNLAELLARSGTARGSIYQHFPGGKAELVEEATRTAGELVLGLAARSDGTAAGYVETLLSSWERALLRHDFGVGCPIAAAALAGEQGAAAVAGQVFSDWSAQLAARLVEEGADPEVARSLASFVVSAAEGAVIQARASRSLQPLDDVRTQVRVLLAHQLREG